MANIQSDYAKGIKSTMYPPGKGYVSSHRYYYDVPAAGHSAGDIVELAPIPPDCTITDIIIDSDDLDSNGTPTIAFDVGVMSGQWGEEGTRTCGAEFFSGDNVGQAGGVSRPSLASAYKVAGQATPRSIGVKWATAAATAAAGQIGLTVFVAAV